jgi:hypothetical protein
MLRRGQNAAAVLPKLHKHLDRFTEGIKAVERRPDST